MQFNSLQEYLQYRLNEGTATRQMKSLMPKSLIISENQKMMLEARASAFGQKGRSVIGGIQNGKIDIPIISNEHSAVRMGKAEPGYINDLLEKALPDIKSLLRQRTIAIAPKSQHAPKFQFEVFDCERSLMALCSLSNANSLPVSGSKKRKDSPFAIELITLISFDGKGINLVPEERWIMIGEPSEKFEEAMETFKAYGNQTGSQYLAYQHNFDPEYSERLSDKKKQQEYDLWDKRGKADCEKSRDVEKAWAEYDSVENERKKGVEGQIAKEIDAIDINNSFFHRKDSLNRADMKGNTSADQIKNIQMDKMFANKKAREQAKQADIDKKIDRLIKNNNLYISHGEGTKQGKEWKKKTFNTTYNLHDKGFLNQDEDEKEMMKNFDKEKYFPDEDKSEN